MKSFKVILFFVFCLGFYSACYAQYDIPPKPSFIPAVIDSTNTLSTSEFRQLSSKLERYSDSTSTEIIVVIIPSTKGENIGLLTPEWAHEWEIGQKDKDNGVFILLAKNDRKIWISPGYGVEDKLTAGQLGEITRQDIIPEFKRNNYYKGLDRGINSIISLLNGTYTNNRARQTSGKFPFGVFVFLFFVFVIIIIALSKSRGGGRGGNRGNKSKGRGLLEAIILSNMGRGSYRSGSSGGFGGGFGGSSGGGFGGFGGGGGFSGGGAGGSW
ncbi:MAG: TPM domain-containing protein [Bacteroidota bacterium]